MKVTSSTGLEAMSISTPWDEYPSKAYLEELAEIPDTEESIEIPARKSKSKKRRSRNKSTSEELDKSYPSYSGLKQLSISTVRPVLCDLPKEH
jgi:hypothetical protein